LLLCYRGDRGLCMLLFSFGLGRDWLPLLPEGSVFLSAPSNSTKRSQSAFFRRGDPSPQFQFSASTFPLSLPDFPSPQPPIAIFNTFLFLVVNRSAMPQDSEQEEQAALSQFFQEVTDHVSTLPQMSLHLLLIASFLLALSLNVPSRVFGGILASFKEHRHSKA